MTANTTKINRIMRSLGFQPTEMGHNVAKLRAHVTESVEKGIPLKLSGAYCPDNLNNEERAWRLLRLAA